MHIGNLEELKKKFNEDLTKSIEVLTESLQNELNNIIEEKQAEFINKQNYIERLNYLYDKTSDNEYLKIIKSKLPFVLRIFSKNMYVMSKCLSEEMQCIIVHFSFRKFDSIFNTRFCYEFWESDLPTD